MFSFFQLFFIVFKDGFIDDAHWTCGNLPSLFCLNPEKLKILHLLSWCHFLYLFYGFSLHYQRHVTGFKYLMGNFHHDQIPKSVLASPFLFVGFLPLSLIHSVQI